MCVCLYSSSTDFIFNLINPGGINSLQNLNPVLHWLCVKCSPHSMWFVTRISAEGSLCLKHAGLSWNWKWLQSFSALQFGAYSVKTSKMLTASCENDDGVESGQEEPIFSSQRLLRWIIKVQLWRAKKTCRSEISSAYWTMQLKRAFVNNTFTSF